MLISAEGHLGNWNKWIFSTRNTSIDTVFIRSQRPCGDCDDTATHGIRFRESTHINPQTFELGGGIYWKKYPCCDQNPKYVRHRFKGYWASARCTGERIYFDPPGQYPRKVITGFRTQVEPPHPTDDTGLNGVQFKCGYGD